MANINLYQSDQTESQRAKASLLDKGMILGLALTALVLLAYGGVEFYLRSLNQRVENLKNEEAAGRAALKDKDVNSAASFQQRLDEIKTNADTFAVENPSMIFEAVQRAVISGAVVSKLNFDGKSVNLSLAAENFEILAKQILSFKGSESFSSVDVSSTSRGENGKVAATLILGIKK